jgi:hypothetical protein
MANALGNHGANPGTPNGSLFVGSNSGSGLMSEEERRAADQKRAARERQRQALNLQRENILSQKTSNPGRRAALEAALAHVEAQLQAMG